MCSVADYLFVDNQKRALRKIVNELSEGSALNSLNIKMDVGRLLFDVVRAIGYDPWAVLNPAIMTRLANEDCIRLWPTAGVSDEADEAETDAIRQPEYSDLDTPISPAGLGAMYHFPWPARAETAD